jgi:hypothetical protein
MFPNFDIPAFKVMNNINLDKIIQVNDKSWRTISSEEIPLGSIPEDEERLDYEDEKEQLNKFSLTESDWI